MKLAVAAGILAQTLPVISEQASVDLLVNSNNNQRQFDLASILASIPREADGSLPVAGRAAGKSQRGQQGRGRGGRRTQSAAKKTGPLMNKAIIEAAKPCNPNSKDPDVGILSCGKGKHCEIDENLFLGGRCVPRTAPEGNVVGKTKAFASFGKGGLLQNIRDATKKASEFTMECDPNAGSADVGILSCEEGKECLVNSASSMGGFCAPDANHNSRELYFLTEEAGICDPTHPDYLYYDCDCTGFDNATGTGDIPCTAFEDYCLGLIYPGCGETCVTRTVDYTFTNFTAPGYSFCFAFTSPYAQRVCFEEFFETDSCEMSFNNEPCTSCDLVTDGNSTFIAFDCANAGGNAGTTEYGIVDLLPVVGACYTPGPLPECPMCPDGKVFNSDYADDVLNVPDVGEFTCNTVYYASYVYLSVAEDYCPAVTAAASDICCSNYCDLCGPTSFIPPANYEIELDVALPGYEGVTCGDLSYAAYYNFTIAPETCSSAAAIAAPCCEEYDITCDLCENGELDPTAVIDLEGDEIPCQFLAVFLNETDCSTVRPLVENTCCIASPGATRAPSEAPAPGGGGGDSQAPAPTAGAAGPLSTKTIVSMVGLAAAAVAFVMN